MQLQIAANERRPAWGEPGAAALHSARQRQAVGSRACRFVLLFGRATVLGQACLDYYRLALWRTTQGGLR